MKRFLPLTYKPKIPGVLNGTIRQTIRVTNKLKWKVGDQIAFHGYENGRGTPWTFRTEYFALKEVWDIVVCQYGLLDLELSEDAEGLIKWEQLDILAALDGINPPTGIELGKVLTSYHKIPETGLQAQTLRW